jgi:transposase-like protein
MVRGVKADLGTLRNWVRLFSGKSVAEKTLKESIESDDKWHLPVGRV